MIMVTQWLIMWRDGGPTTIEVYELSTCFEHLEECSAKELFDYLLGTPLGSPEPKNVSTYYRVSSVELLISALALMMER
jgi:hypothetical protein